jgi:hypothetical protein
VQNYQRRRGWFALVKKMEQGSSHRRKQVET